MKKITCLLAFVFCFLLASTCFAFKEAPVAVLVMGDKTAFDSELVGLWQERIKRRFRFPDYKIMSQQEVGQGLGASSLTLDAKRPYFKKAQLEQLAQLIPAELVLVIWVERIDEIISRSYFRVDETFATVNVSIDVTAYRKTDDKYLTEKIRYSKTEDFAMSTPARRVATDGIAEIVDKFKAQLPRLEE